MTEPSSRLQREPWPPLPYPAWKDTCATLHLWTQIVGKIRLARTPWVNHSWHVTLYVTPRGLGTSPIPDDGRAFQIEFDFLDHALLIATSDGGGRAPAARAQSVADFHDRLMAALAGLGSQSGSMAAPNEVPDPIPFRADREHAAYDPDAAQRFWRVLVQADRVLQAVPHRLPRQGEPGAFLLGQLRSGGDAVLRAPRRRCIPGAIPHLPDAVTREAYSHEVSSAGFWPGGGAIDYPAFYAYAYPEPEGFATRRSGRRRRSSTRRWASSSCPMTRSGPPLRRMRRCSTSCRRTYEAAANAAAWDRAALDCPQGRAGVPRPVG